MRLGREIENYHSRREAQERRLAWRAHDDHVKRIHLELADAHARHSDCASVPADDCGADVRLAGFHLRTPGLPDGDLQVE